MIRLEKIISQALKRVNDDHYLLAVVTAKRAEDIIDGAKPLISEEKIEKYGISKPVDIALVELAEGKLEFHIQ